MKNEPKWYNPLKKYTITSFINLNDSSKDIDIYYTKKQLLKKDWQYIVYCFKKYIWAIITFIFTILGFFISIYSNEIKIFIDNLIN
jgi:hypothetical protein